jgi:uncharacterized protein YkwD
MHNRVLLVAVSMAWVACEAPVRVIEPTRHAELGEPGDGFPDWSERAVLVWTNRARCDPAADLLDCTVCAEKACYGPVPPVAWNHNLGRAARFHSANLSLGGCALQHPSPCTLLTTIGADYTPGPCSGAPACACAGGSAVCGSTGTAWSTRVGYFGTAASAENIARGYTDPVRTFYLWLWEPDANPACGWRIDNGHRANILGGSNLLGVGRYSSTYTQDFGRGTVPTGIVSGVHYPQTGSALAFRANWYATSGPVTAMVSVEGSCHPMTLERGSASNGTYLASVSGLPTTCQRYVFHFTDATGDVFYPTTGSYGIGCSSDWLDTRPAPCGPCTPDCTDRSCGDDGCGGSCGSCDDGLSCAAGACVCLGTVCTGSCVDTSNDPANCGSCGHACDPGQICAGGECLCQPSCSGKVCGDDGCGGICGICATDRTCGATGQCVCVDGTDCSGSCVDTTRDPTNCGTCGLRCLGNTKFCVDSTCVGECRPRCGGKECGNDGCGGLCGTCAPTQTCSAKGDCVCPTGTVDCSGTCADLQTNPLHCSGCGLPCDPGDLCVNGTCTPAPLDASVPDTAQPDSAQPDAAQPDSAQPDRAQPDAAQPDAAQPDTAQPDTAQPDAAQPDTAQPDTAQPDAAQPDAAQPDTAQPDAAHPDAAQPDTAQPDAAHPDAAQPDTAQPDVLPLDAAAQDSAPGDVVAEDAAPADTLAQDAAQADGSSADGVVADRPLPDQVAQDTAIVDGASALDSAGLDTMALRVDAAVDAGTAAGPQRAELAAEGCSCRVHDARTASGLAAVLVLLLLGRRRQRA